MEKDSLFHSLRRAAPWVAGMICVAVVIAGFWWVVTASNAEDNAWAKAQKRAFARANVICGDAPRSITAHGSSWNFGLWLQVTCKDGTVRVVQP